MVATASEGLNPCSNGMKIEFIPLLTPITVIRSLNPCSNGMKIEYIKNSTAPGTIKVS